MTHPAADVLPRPFGAYLLLQSFARGGMGEVYLAKSGGIAGLERICVIKKLRHELTGDREYVTRFVDEARVVVTLNHANICSVFDVGRVPGAAGAGGGVDEYYLAMEYVAGADLRSLHDRWRQRSLIPDAAVIVHIVCEVLKALDYAHRRRHPVTGEPLQLVHRDVSPQNVLVSYEGEVKLIDFGLAASRLKVERTAPNVVMGKLAYMPPEQARGDPVDSRADLFACAVMLYELFVNERYYEGLSASDVWQVAGRGSFTPRAWSQMDPGLQPVLARALHPDPQRRPETCGEFREQLLQWGASRGIAGAERRLRHVLEQVCVDEIAQESATMARFGGVTVASLRSDAAISRARPAPLLVHDRTVFDAARPAVPSTDDSPVTDPDVGTEDAASVGPPSRRSSKEARHIEATQIARVRHDSEDDSTSALESTTLVAVEASPVSHRVVAVLAAAVAVLALLAWGVWRGPIGAPSVGPEPSLLSATTTPTAPTAPTPSTPVAPATAALPAPADAPATSDELTTRRVPRTIGAMRPRSRSTPSALPATSSPSSPSSPSALPAASATPKPRGPVSSSAFDALVRANPRCVRALLTERTKVRPDRFLVDYADAIRACGLKASIVVP